MASALFKKLLPTQRLLFTAFILFAAIFTDSFAVGQINVEPNTALLNEGDRSELLCRYERPINYCRIEIPGEKVLNLSPDWSKTPGFTYFGVGFGAGQCGVIIERVKAINNGQVKCSLGVEGEELSGSIDLVVALRPQKPKIELAIKPDREGYLTEGNVFQARCTVRDGRPAANISWYIDDQPANKRVTQLSIEASPSDRNMTLSTTKQEIQWQLTSEDNGRKLICRSHHQTDRENVPPQEDSYLLLVRFAPVPQPETLVYGLYLEQTALINITIRANPAPSIEWTVDGVVLPQRSEDGRIEVYEPQYLGQDQYNVTIAIAGLTLKDTTKLYEMKASNAYGSTDYALRISSSSTPPSTGLEVGAIVGIVVAVAVLVLIVLLVLFARATGRWCFGGKSIKTPTNETGQRTAHAHGQNVALLETANGAAVVTIIGNRHTNDAAPIGNGSLLRRSQTELDEDDSFEYATDRESSVYNATTTPIRTVMGAAGGRNSQRGVTGAAATADASESADLLTRGNQLGIPASRFARWLPKDQREIIEKQAKLLANRAQPKAAEVECAAATRASSDTATPPQETEI